MPFNRINILPKPWKSARGGCDPPAKNYSGEGADLEVQFLDAFNKRWKTRLFLSLTIVTPPPPPRGTFRFLKLAIFKIWKICSILTNMQIICTCPFKNLPVLALYDSSGQTRFIKFDEHCPTKFIKFDERCPTTTCIKFDELCWTRFIKFDEPCLTTFIKFDELCWTRFIKFDEPCLTTFIKFDELCGTMFIKFDEPWIV